MDIAHQLLRSICRSFYPPDHILIIDALIIHSALRDDDLAYLMNQQVKYLRKICGRLREDGLLSVHSRPEVREGALRAFNRDYYWIDFHRAVDVIKYRLKMMNKEVERRFGQTHDEKKEYRCPRCENEYTQMEVLDMVGSMGFICRRCQFMPLALKDNSGETHAGHEVQSRLNAQLSPFENLLRQIDNTVIPEVDFDKALEKAKPVLRNESINPAVKSEVVGQRLLPSTVHGLKTEPDKIQVNLVDSTQEALAKQEAERRAKEQNALPDWYTKSTITTPYAGADSEAKKDQHVADVKPNIIKTDDDEKKDIEHTDGQSIADFWAMYEAEQAKKAKEEQEDDDEDDEDDDEDDGFEDVGLEPNMKPINLDIEQPADKRARVDQNQHQIPSSTEGTGVVARPTTQTQSNEGEDSEEDADFEDAL